MYLRQNCEQIGIEEFFLPFGGKLEKNNCGVWACVSHIVHKLPYSAGKARKSYLKLAKSRRWTEEKCREAIADQLRFIELAMKRLE